LMWRFNETSYVEIFIIWTLLILYLYMHIYMCIYIYKIYIYLQIHIYHVCIYSLHIVGTCSSSDFECPPQAYVLKAWSVEWWPWEVVEPLGGRALWKALRSLGACLQRRLWGLHFFLFLYCFLCMRWSFALVHAPTMMCCLPTGPNQWCQLIM
jgi:hypothetical protein